MVLGLTVLALAVALYVGRIWWNVRRHPEFVVQRLATAAGNALARGHQEWAESAFLLANFLLPRRSALLVEALAYNDLGLTHARRGKHLEAAAPLEKALDRFQNAGNDKGRAAVLNSLADVYDHLGDTTGALAALNNALDFARSSGNPALERQTLGNLGAHYAKVGDNQRAMDTLRSALAVTGLSTDGQTVSSINLNLAELASGRAEYGAAETYLEDAKGALPGGLDDNFHYHYNVGIVRYHVGKYADAMTAFERALELARREGNALLEGFVLNAMGTNHNFLRQPDGALECFRKALPLRRSGSPEEGTTLDGMASSLMLLGRLDEAQAMYEKALPLRRGAVNQKDEAITVHNMAYLASRRGDDAQANAMLTVALHMRRQVSDHAGEMTTLAVLGEVAVRAGRDADAVEWLSQAISIREQIRAGARVEDLLLALDDDAGDTYARAIGALVRLNRIEDAFNMSERARARVFLERIAGPQGPPDRREPIAGDIAPLTTTQIQQALDPDLTLVSYVESDRDTHAFVLTKNDLRHYHIETDYKRMPAVMHQVRSPDTHPGAALQQLYTCLVEPFAASLDTERLAIAATGLLQWVPFAALMNNGEFFGDTHPITYVPTASALVYLQRKRKNVPLSVLALAYGEAKGLQVLHFVNSEVDQISAVIPSAKTLKGAAARESAVHAEAAQFTVLHLAAHGLFDWAQPLRSRIVLAPDPQRDGSLTAEDIYALHLPDTELVVLSACDTHVGAPAGGQETMALSRAFAIAGARAVLATLWPVDDKATGALMGAFYRHYATTRQASLALRQAQIEARRDYAHPYFWGAFTVLGDAGPS